MSLLNTSRMIQSRRSASSPALRFSMTGISRAKRAVPGCFVVIGKYTTKSPLGRESLGPTATGRSLRPSVSPWPASFAHKYDNDRRGLDGVLSAHGYFLRDRHRYRPPPLIRRAIRVAWFRGCPPLEHHISASTAHKRGLLRCVIVTGCRRASAIISPDFLERSLVEYEL